MADLSTVKVEEQSPLEPFVALSWPTARALDTPPKVVLPEPTYRAQNQPKKPHTKRRPDGYVPRPRNPFILFRSDFVRQKTIPSSVEKDHRNISRIVGRVWQEMSQDERQPWVIMAEKEKVEHSKRYRGYRFGAGNAAAKKKTKRGDDEPPDTKAETPLESILTFETFPRYASCPVGDRHVPQANVENQMEFGAPLKTRDDLSRRPSRVVLYRSSSDPSSELDTSALPCGLPSHLTSNNPDDLRPWMEGKDDSINSPSTEGAPDHNSQFCNGPLFTESYFPPPPSSIPSWEMYSRPAITVDEWILLETAELYGGDPPSFINPFTNIALPTVPHIEYLDKEGDFDYKQAAIDIPALFYDDDLFGARSSGSDKSGHETDPQGDRGLTRASLTSLPDDFRNALKNPTDSSDERI